MTNAPLAKVLRLESRAPSAGRRTLTVLCSAGLFALNAAILWPLFTVEYLRQLYSSDGTFIAISRYMLRSSGDSGWWPWWGTGLPFQNTYVPGLPAMVAFVSRVAALSPARAYHIVTAVTYCVAPVALFLLALSMSHRLAPSFAAGLAYSLTSPSTLLIPIIRQDAGGFANPQRLRALVFYGGGPQVATLALVPLAVLLFHAALSRRQPWMCVAAGVSAACVALTNAFGVVFLGLAIACLLVTVRERPFRNRLALVLTIGSLTYLCICRWLPPSLLRVASRDAQMAGGDFRWGPRSALAIGMVVLLFVATLFLTRKCRDLHLRFFLLLSVLLTSITMLGSQLDLNALPQPTRFHVEMEIPLCAVAAFAAGRLWRISNRGARAAMMSAVAVLAGFQTVHCRNFARELILPPADLSNSVEYRISRRMAALFGSERVIIAGSPALFANVFTDVRQLAGAHDQFNANPSLLAAGFLQYGGFHGNYLDGPTYVLWMKAFGVHGVNVAGSESQDPYKPFRRNYKLFDGLLPVVERDGGDTIYRVPERANGLARVVPLGAIVRQPPRSPRDVNAVARYVAAVEDPALPVPSWEERDRNSIIVRASVQPNQVVSVATTYSPGWHATVRNAPQPTFADGLGMLVVAPSCVGSCEMRLYYDGGAEAAFTKWLSCLSLGGTGLWILVNLLDKHRLRPPKDRH
jgi:hypothetical protein